MNSSILDDNMHDESERSSLLMFRRVGRVVAVNVLLLIALLLLVEMSLRLLHIPFRDDWEPLETAIARFDKELGWAYLPNLARHIEFEAYGRDVFTDANGIRVPEAGYRLQSGRPSALFIGCSYTMGHGLSYGESFVGQFGDLAGDRLQVVNLGVQAYGTDQALLSLKSFAPLFDTKVVVYTFMDEHITRNGNYDRRTLIPDARFIGTKPLFGLSPDQTPVLLKKPLPYEDYRHSWLLDALYMKLGPMLGGYPPYPEKLTHALILEMDRFCKQRGIRFILLNWRWSEQDYNGFVDLPVEQIDTMQSAPEGWELMRIPGDNHPDVAAGTHVANILKQQLQRIDK